MKLTTLLLVGAAALATPALAQSAATGASGDAQTSPSASAAQPADPSASATNQTAANGTASQPANADTASNAASNSQMAMNNGGASASTSGGADISALSSVPDTQKKYKRSSRATDFSKEAETTKQLNQQVASAGGLPKTQQ